MNEKHIEAVARLCHQTNKAYCELLGDKSQKNWENAPGWQRRSAIAGVMKVISGEVSNPGDCHESWSEAKIAEGWTYGPVKDDKKKTHPCLVPFMELPVEQRVKDILFISTAVSGILTFDPDWRPSKGGM